MATVTTQVLHLGYYSRKLDSNQNKVGAEDADLLRNVTFGSVNNPLWQTRSAMTMVDGSNDGQVAFGGTTYTSRTQDYVQFNTPTGVVNRTIDTGVMYRAEVTYWDGTKVTSDVRVIQDGAGNLYLLAPPGSASSSEVSAMTAHPIASLKILRVVNTNFDGLDTTRIGLPGDPTFACFAAETLIRTATGERRADSLSVGDLVLTAEGAARPILWLGKRTLAAATLAHLPKLRPMRIAAGALGLNTPTQDLCVSPQHRVLIRSKVAQNMFGVDEVLVAAKHLSSLPGIHQIEDSAEVTYVHFLLENHEVVYANGAMTESMYSGVQALEMVGAEARAEILGLFPELANPAHVAAPARTLIEGRKGRKLAERMAKKLAA